MYSQAILSMLFVGAHTYMLRVHNAIRYGPTEYKNVDEFEYYRRLAIYIIHRSHENKQKWTGTIESDKIQFNTTEYFPHNAHGNRDRIWCRDFNLKSKQVPRQTIVYYFDRSFNNLSLSINLTVSIVVPFAVTKTKICFSISSLSFQYIYTYT